MGKGTNISKYKFNNKKDKCINLLINSLHYNGLESLKYLDLTPLDLVLGVHKGSAHGDYLPVSMVGALISVKKFFRLEQSYPGLPSVVYLDMILLEKYLSLWPSEKQTGILPC